MATKKMTAAQIDAHLEKVAPKTKAGAKGKFDLKKTYTTVRPVLVFAGTFLMMFKPKWATELNNFVAGMDAYTKYTEPVIP